MKKAVIQNNMREKDCYIEYSSGNGGFTVQNDFVLDSVPALPHSNIIAHKDFGTLITDSGGGYTWFQNSRENKITDWKNDPVYDIPSESVIITDKLTDTRFSISRLPLFRKSARYKVMHSFGESSFFLESGSLACRLNQFLDIDREIKYYEIIIENKGKKRRSFNALLKLKLVLGDFRHNTVRNIYAVKNGNGVLAQNAVSGATAYVYTETEVFTCSCSEGALEIGADIHVGAGEKARLLFALSPHPGRAIDIETAERARLRSRGFFSRLSKIHIKTPDKALDAIAAWLPYQVYCSRYVGRCGFYQAGGAYGFRDQLQDCLALLYADPALVREHIIRAASHQFIEGDVQHWWHPEKTGIRTRMTDDFLWLPYVAAEYIEFTGDRGILDVYAPYLQMSELPAGTDVVYNSPPYSDKGGTIREHCVKALLRAHRFGPNGLNLIGTGDWNDSFDEIGKSGRGESVWLAEFYYIVIEKFLPYIREPKAEEELSAALPLLKQSVLKNAWDGRWFVRAFWDDGQPIGSSSGGEAQIDLISNAFAILAGFVSGEKAFDCIAAVREKLVDREAGIIKLLDPPFTKEGKRAGYVNDYPPGTRENGGQYTHAAIWYVQSLYKLGLCEEAYEMFSMINPVNRCLTKEGADKYGAEPYVIAADVYSGVHSGRAGWSYYTGSAAWMYKTAVECVLGLKKEGNRLFIRPKTPEAWKEFSASYGENVFIRAVNTHGKSKRVIVNDKEQSLEHIELDGTEKNVIVEY